MSKEKIVEKDPTLKEYEDLIEGLLKENEELKQKIAELEEQYNVPKTPTKKKEEIPVPKDTKKPAKSLKESKKKEESEEIKQKPKFKAKGIVEGTSRRECPECGNSKIKLIREAVDKTVVILDYPKVYGKKLLCGSCGADWRVSTEF